MCVPNWGASNGKEGNGEIDRSLLKGCLLVQSVVLAICKIWEKVLLTVLVLLEVAKTRAKRGGALTMRHLETRRQSPRS